ncbi:MAG TPA: T9SS type A sorting domain-containing protein [Flavobacteriales bacterium]|nr:T9SS type A sorting domain-containing protein [Flavobacteriales bacterium]
MRLLLLPAVLTVLHAQALTVSITVMSHSYCGQANASMRADVSGGTPPYTYAWSNGGADMYNLGVAPGIYTVTVTDALLDQQTAQAEVLSMPSHVFVSYNEEGGWCLGEQPYVSFYAGTENGMPPDPSATGTMHTPGPYSFDAVGFSESWQELQDACSPYAYYVISMNAPAGTNVTVNFTDGAGCPGTFNTTIRPPIVFPAMQVVDVSGSCSNGAIGSATVSIAPSTQALVLHLRNAVGDYVPDDCAVNWSGVDSFTFTNLAPGTYWAVLDCDLFNQFANGTFCTDSVEIVIPDLGTTCGHVSGRIYVDGNANCAFNGGENMVPNTVIEVTPGPQYVTTDAYGLYDIDLPYGTYTLTEQHPVLDQGCPAQFTLSSAQLPNINIGCLAGAPLDVQLMMANGPARPGFELHYGINIDNLTPSPTGDVTLTVQFDPALGYISAVPTPTSVVGNTITWTAPWFTMTNAFQHKEVGVRLLVPPDLGLVGTTLNTTATIVTTNTDVDLGNNTVGSAEVVTASFDPNEKTAVTSTQGEQGLYLIDADQWIDYTIRFQNTGTDTAFNVIITDTLPTTLDPATIQWGPASHTCTRELSGPGYLKFIFANILLPDSNVNEAASHGFVSFRIRPRLPLLAGTSIENTANIFFDFNEPVITEPSVLAAEFSTQVDDLSRNDVLLFPNPVNDVLIVRTSLTAPYLVELIACDGRVVRTERGNGERMSLAISDLPMGSYFCRVTGATGRGTAGFIKTSER